jgi:hypothetical protein
MRHRYLALSASILIASGCSSSDQARTIEPALTVKVKVNSTVTDRKVEVTAINTGDIVLGVSHTFGYEDVYFGLEIDDQDGTLVFVPDWELFSVPGHACLKPGQALGFSVDLFGWRRILGGTPEGEKHYVDLPPGVYRARAVYKGVPVKSIRHCRAFEQTSESPWVEFRVPP